jgi:hypothetical protein
MHFPARPQPSKSPRCCRSAASEPINTTRAMQVGSCAPSTSDGLARSACLQHQHQPLASTHSSYKTYLRALHTVAARSSNSCLCHKGHWPHRVGVWVPFAAARHRHAGSVAAVIQAILPTCSSTAAMRKRIVLAESSKGHTKACMLRQLNPCKERMGLWMHTYSVAQHAEEHSRHCTVAATIIA